ncbi:MAG TPA: UvrD-helicase domain-containing protein [Gemmatimonadaceae bacterium]|nr:UvrD-helicase domain-containing protein [Gemmatimonadaceae bacterium]
MTIGRGLTEPPPGDLDPMLPRVPSDSQRAAIEGPVGPILVLAGPGAGKTFCLIERIRFLLERLELVPERICAFTFTNKAAGEIAERLERTLGERAAQVRTGTIHAFCAELLRELGSGIGIEPGFGIADENYQRAVLRRLGVPPQWHTGLLSRFGSHRFRREPFQYRNDAELFERYERFLAQRRVLDFDMLVIRTVELLADTDIARKIRASWDCVLVDEFQDLNPLQYRIIRELARDHHHVFAVGDEEQSIYSWAGADPRVFLEFMNDFGIRTTVTLRENRRCPREILSLARRLIEINPSMFAERKMLDADRDSPFCVEALDFPTDDAEIAWVLDDLRRDRDAHDVAWGDFALLYRKHQIGDAAEAAFLAAGLPCRLALGRALGEDPIVGYVVAALRVIAGPDELHEEAFLELVLPTPLIDGARAAADEARRTLREQLERTARDLPRDHGDGRKIRRAFSTLNNLGALGHRHTTLGELVEELLSQRVGPYRTVLEEHHDELTDPRAHTTVVRLAARLTAALSAGRHVSIPRLGGVEIALKGLLAGVGVRVVPPDEAPSNAERIDAADGGSLGLPLAVFKAAQLLRSGSFTNVFRDFTAIDVETTDRDVERAELVEIAAVRVRDGLVVADFHSLVRPRGRITPGALRTHGISAADVASAPSFDEVWPKVREFCGADVLVAHNGYHFDFPILRRLSGTALCTYDTLPLARDLQPGSAKLVDLARYFGIDPGSSHRALDDTRTLARVCLALHEAKVAYARKTSLVNLLDHLGVALALSGEELDREAELLRRLCRPYALGRYSDCLEFYRLEREQSGDASLPSVRDLIERLGGEKVMERIRAGKTADERYPASMARLRRLIEQCTAGTLNDQISRLLEQVALSRADGVNPEIERVNLLTLHSTKGLEFSRVYILGVEDAQLPGGSPARGASTAETEEARRLLYVGMTRAKDRLVLTRVAARTGQVTGGHRFLDEMGLVPRAPE